MARESTTSFFFRPTGKNRTIAPEFGKSYTLPEVALVRTQDAGELDSFSGVAEVEGHGFFYLWEANHEYDGNKGAVLLSRTVESYDAGDNPQRKVTAPEATGGICAPVTRGGPTLSKSHGTPEFAATPGDYTGILEN